MCTVFQSLPGHIRMSIEPGTLPYQETESMESMLGLSLFVGILFPASGLKNVPLFYSASMTLMYVFPHPFPLPCFQYVRLYGRGIGILLLQHKWCAYRPTALHQMLAMRNWWTLLELILPCLFFVWVKAMLHPVLDYCVVLGSSAT